MPQTEQVMDPPAATTTKVAAPTRSFPSRDDGHIFVCVRVRNVPQNPCLTASAPASVNASGQPRKTTALREAQKICVSTLENIVVMHDPKSLDDPSTVARDGNNVVQLLTDRANAPAAGGSRPSARPSSSRKSAVPSATRTRSSTALGRQSTVKRSLIGTQTASYFECDRCVASMDAASMLRMPIIKNSDFLQPPAYGSQEDVYRATAEHAVSAAVEGINSCVFAYGQTGSGKTYTLFGDTANIRCDPGIVPRTLDDLFGRLEDLKRTYSASAGTDYSYAVSLSFFEIYQNEVYCLFSRQGPLHVHVLRDPCGRKETMTISDLQQHSVTCAKKAYPLVEMGLRRRQTGETGMNARSSRSHAILQVHVTQWRTDRATREGVEHRAVINLVDLAGSERQRTANAQGKNREEGIHINQSLATLARVINDIASGAKFVNYRDSLLTMVLKDNLGGNSRTFMIATVSPIAFSYQESCATLTYAKDVRRIRNRPVVNRTFQTKASLLEQNAQLKSDNERLREQMEEWMRRSKAGSHGRGCGGGQGGATAMSGVLGGSHEVLLAAAGVAGLTAPLIVSTHRRYTSVAGDGGSCAEGAVVRVTALARETVRLRLHDVLRQGSPDPVAAGVCAAAVTEGMTAALASPHDSAGEGGEGEAGDKENAPPRALSVATASRTPREQGRAETGQGARSRMSASSPSPRRQGSSEGLAAAAAATTGSTDDQVDRAGEGTDYGVLEFARVAPRACEQRFYVRYLPPPGDSALASLVDIQVNGTSVGTGAHRELRHGDVVCAFLDGAAGSGTQSLLSFHYVDPNCLARDTPSLKDTTTLRQLAVSVDLPSEVEGLTLGDIQQLQRDRDKLLDLVQQQKQTIEFQLQQQQQRSGVRECSFISISSSPEIATDSPVARSVSLGGTTHALPQRAVLEPFRRTSVSPSIRARSQLPADVEQGELLRRALGQSQSQARYESAVDENRRLHRAVAGRNATLEALARRLAELEAGDSPSRPRQTGSAEPICHTTTVSGSEDGAGRESERQSDTSADRAGSRDAYLAAPLSVSQATRSLTRISVSSTDDDDGGGAEEGQDRSPVAVHETAARGGDCVCVSTGPAPLSVPCTQEMEASPVRAKAFFEGAEGARERYKAALREAALHARLAELEARIDDLQGEAQVQEGRLRIARDDTLEQEMLRAQVELERDALLRELASLRAENAVLSRDTEALEVYLRRSEDALAAALVVGDEELLCKARGLTEQLHALKALALLWKRRAMKYIAQGYGEAAGSPPLTHFPWEDVRYGSSAEAAKALLRRTRGEVSDEAAAVVDAFEKDTAVESVLALEAALQDLERENRRLQAEMARCEGSLRELHERMACLRGERDALETEMANTTAMDEEERRRLQRMLDETNRNLGEAEKRFGVVQQSLEECVRLSKENARRASAKHDQLLEEQRAKMREMESSMANLQDSIACKDEELRTLLRYMEDSELVGLDGTVRDMGLRNRIEDLISAAMKNHEAPTGYSAFPTEFRFSEEMIALIRVALRTLLDRLKVELYVLNKQSLHRFGLLVPTVQLRPEAQFQIFMHDLRGVIAEIAGRAQRVGGKWSVSEGDVLSGLVDHRRRRAEGALCGLLIWYDHWDLSTKSEHVCYMELIRNADRIMQMARRVRQESFVNTNATSTLLMPIPSTTGKSESTYISENSRRADRTVSDSRRILSRLRENHHRGYLATALSEAVGGTCGGDGGGGAAATAAKDASDGPGTRPFSRSATALALSQSLSFRRTSSAVPMAHDSLSAPPAKPHRPTVLGSGRGGGDGLEGPSLPLGPRASAASASTKMAAAVERRGAGCGAYHRVASAGVLPVSDSDIAYVASADVEYASSLNRFRHERRASAGGASGMGTPPPSSNPPSRGVDRGGCVEEGPGRSSCRPSAAFSRCQTAFATAGRASNGAAGCPGRGTTTRPSAKGRAPTTTATNTTSTFGRSRSALVGVGGGGPRYSGVISPKPRTPVGVESKAKRPTARAAATAVVSTSLAPRGSSGEGRFAAPTSFYNPSIMEALRQRSASVSNRPSVNLSGKRKRTAGGASKAKMRGNGGQCAKSARAFEASRPSATLPRRSTGAAASSSRGSATPVVPPLDLTYLSR